MIPTQTLVGERVRLRPLDERDVPLLARWFADAEVSYWTHLSEDPPHRRTVAAHQERFEHIREDPRQLRWCMETAGGQPIGDIALLDIHPHGRAELGITIGEKAYWGAGYGREAIEQVVRYAFHQLGCRRVYLITDIDNLRAQQCFKRCGFVTEGQLRAHRLRYGQPLDMLIMGILRDDPQPPLTP
jgi:RimJ/RimL family protein N-acetyltransferase